MIAAAESMAQALEAALDAGSGQAYIFAFALGVLTSLTPCVYPLLPLVVGYIGSLSKGRKLNAFFYSLTYVLGMAIVYSALGFVVALGHGFIGQTFTQPILLLLVANFFLLIGLWAMGAFILPSFLRGASGKQSASGERHRGLAGSFVVGAASALVVGPCSTPTLLLLLSVLGTSLKGRAVGNVIFAATVMFTFAFGIGMLLLVCGTFSGILASLPKSGKWLNVTKTLMVVLLLLMAEMFMVYAGQQMKSIVEYSGLTAPLVLAALGTLLIVTGALVAIMRAVERSKPGAKRRLLVIGILMLVVGQLFVLLASQGLPPLAMLLA